MHLKTFSFFLVFWLGILNAWSQPLSSIQPKNQAFEHNQTPTFSWNALYGATDYTIILAQDPAFTINLNQSPLLTSTYWTSGSLSFGNWYWKIQATTIAGTVESSTYAFTIYNPTQQSNISLWLKADAGVTLDINNKVQSWQDQSINNYLLLQSNDTKKPIVETNNLNNFPAIKFSGGQVLNGGDILDLGNQSRSMFVVGKMGGNDQTLFAKSNSLAASSRYALMKFGSQSTIIYQEAADNHLLCPTSTINKALYHFENNRNTSTNRLFLNNVMIGLKAINGSFNFASSFRFLIGAFNGSNDIGESFFLNGDINEILFLDNPTSTDISNTNNYLIYKYAPPINLGKDTLLANFCTYTIIPSTGFTNYSWSTGETTPTINVNQSGTYWVQATNLFGVTSSDTIIVTYPTIPPPTFNGICVNETMTWNADMGPGFTYLWSTGETTASINISAAGIYSVQVTDGFGCSKNSGDYLFNIDTYSQTAFLGNDTTLCNGNFIALQVGGFETISYTWPDASTGSSYAVDTTGNYFLESMNYNGCVAQDTIHVTVSGTAPAANFALNNECLGTAADFMDQSVPAGADPIDSWSWDMGDGNILTSQNPSHVYATAGSFPVELYVESQGGCGAYFTDTIVIYAKPTAAYTFTGHCAEYSIQFTDESVDGSVPITNYLWDFDMPWTGAYNTSTISVPNRIFDTDGTYDVFFKVTDGNGCVDSVTQTVVIDPTPQADFTFSDGCVNTAIQFTNTSVTQPSSTYLYTFPDLSTSIIPNPSKAFTSYGLQTVNLQVTNGFGCVGSIDHDVAVHPNPIPAIDLGPYCMGTYMEANDASTIPLGSIDSSVWIFNTTDTLSGSSVYYLIESLGQQQVQLVSYSDQGCSSTLSQFIDVTNALDVSFTSSGIAAVGDPMSFNNTSTGTTVALWNFGDGTFSTDFSPEHVYDASYLDSIVDVYLIAMTTSGCADTAFQSISVQRAMIDLELTQLYLQKQNDLYIVGVKMKNVGSVKLETIQLDMEMQKGILFSETVNAQLLPQDDTIYVFTGKPSAYISEQDKTDAFICVDGIGYDGNGVAESYLVNNTVCKNIEGDNVVLMPIYPNPVSENMTVEVLVTVESELSVKLFDSRGREVRAIVPQQTLAAGFYTYTINVEDIAEGTYFIRMKSGEGEVMEKVVVGD